MFNYPFLFLGFFLFVGYSNAFTQSVGTQLSNLHLDTLHILVPKYNNKISALEDLLRLETNENKRLRLERQLHSANFLQNQSAGILNGLMDSLYTFSAFSLVNHYDSQTIQSLDFYAVFGILESGAEALIIHRNGEPLKRPFPYYVRKYPLSSWFGSKRQYPEIMRDMIQTLDQKLWRVYQKLN